MTSEEIPLPASASDVDVVRRFINLVASGSEGVEALTAPDLNVVTHPNLFAPNGHVRSHAESAAARQAGKQIAPAQTWDIRTIEETSSGRVTVRVTWSTTLAAAAGPYAAGTQLRAELAQFFELRGGLISRIETFDCYYPPHMP